MYNTNILLTLHVLFILQIVNTECKAGTNQHYSSKFLHDCIIMTVFCIKRVPKIFVFSNVKCDPEAS